MYKPIPASSCRSSSNRAIPRRRAHAGRRRAHPPVLVELKLQELVPELALVAHVIPQVEIVRHAGAAAAAAG